MTEDRLVADGWMEERPCRVTIDTGVSATAARPDNVVELPEKGAGRQCVLQVGSVRTIPVVREALALGQMSRKIWVFVADISEEFILGLNILRAYQATVDVGRHGLRLGQHDMPVREASTASVLTRSRSTENHINGRPVC
jgi:hypothetical protein